jgi:hypothetical protein
MAKGIMQSATDAVKTVAGAAVGAAAAAAATVVVESVANSIRAKGRGQAPPTPAAPAVEDAVRQLLTPPSKSKSAPRKMPKTTAQPQKAVKKKAASKKKIAAKKKSKPIAKKKQAAKVKKARKRR